jgi:molybdate transport system substrate-binding protein
MRGRVYRKQLAALLAMFSISLPGRAGETLVAVAANFSEPMRAITAIFEQHSTHRVRLTFASSGKLYAQIRHGAPFDALLSADAAKPAALEMDGLAVPGSRFTYANGRLVLWSSGGGDAKALLQRGDFRRLAIANPRLAPYGAAAVDVLAGLGLLEAVQPKLVTAENISQAYQFVASGNVPLGFLALSQVMREGRLPAGTWLVPAARHRAIEQDAVLLQRARDNQATRELLQFLREDTALAILRTYGYHRGDRE